MDVFERGHTLDSTSPQWWCHHIQNTYTQTHFKYFGVLFILKGFFLLQFFYYALNGQKLNITVCTQHTLNINKSENLETSEFEVRLKSSILYGYVCLFVLHVFKSIKIDILNVLLPTYYKTFFIIAHVETISTFARYKSGSLKFHAYFKAFSKNVYLQIN